VDDLFGISAGTGKPLAAAEVNGDGQDDLIVGAYSHKQGSRVHIFYGQDLKPGVTPQEANATIIVNEYSFGSSILAGEVDGDGKADLLVEDFGDVDGNGRDDIIIASPPTNSVYIFTHPRLGQQQITTEADFIITGDSQAGITVRKPFTGNIAGPSAPELFISATTNTSAPNTTGLVHVYDQSSLTAVQERVDITPHSPFLYQNYPNPFNPGTEIRFALPAASEVQLVIYDLHGREVLQLIGQKQPAGFHAVHWDGRDQKGVPVSSGVYLYRLTTGRFCEVRKAVLLR
jgi:hypothetical protein